jgi:hypothetical protein
MSSAIVNINVNDDVKMWERALIDAQAGLRRANRDLDGWKQTVQIIRKKIADGAPWPRSRGSESQTDATRN